MLRRSWTVILVSIALLLALAAPTLAGGWATIALDSPPKAPVAGETQSIGFTVLQHGHNPVHEIYGEKITPHLTAMNRTTGEKVRVEARQQGAVGHFVAEVTFPSAGTWEWEITPDPFPLVMDAGMVSGHSHAAGTHEEAAQASQTWTSVSAFTPLTVSAPEPAILGVKLTNAVRAGSVTLLALLVAAVAALAVRSSGRRPFAKPAAAVGGQSPAK